MKRLLCVISVALVALALAASASAQQPGTGPGPGGGFRGDPPSPGGVGLLVTDRDQVRDHLYLRLRERDCDVRLLGLTAQGRWLLYIPLAPGFVNRDFPELVPAGTPFLVRCADHAPLALRLTEADDGASVSVVSGDRLRVALTSNPSTGYQWVLDPALDEAILRPIAESFFVPDSDLLGAPGLEIIDFEAIGTGVAELRLHYRRGDEPPIDTWSVTITVTP